MSVKREAFAPSAVAMRKVNGYQLFSPAVSVEGGSRVVFVSGQVSKDADGNVVGKGDMRAQIERVGENVRHCLEAAGATVADIVQTVTYVTDIDEFFKYPEIRNRLFGPALPTSTTVEVRRLAGPDYMVEVSAIAVV